MEEMWGVRGYLQFLAYKHLQNIDIYQNWLISHYLLNR
jgi:hypothetical protein